MITTDMAVRGFVFGLATLATMFVAVAPAIAAFVLVGRRTDNPIAMLLVLAGFLVYAAALAVALTVLLVNTGIAAWVETG